MKSLFEFDEEIEESLWILADGGFLLLETENDYYIGCDATNSKSVKILQKNTEFFKAFKAILVNSMAMLIRYVDDVPEVAYDLSENVSSTITMIFPKAKNLNKDILLKNNRIAITITFNNFFKVLISTYKKPLFYKKIKKFHNENLNDFYCFNSKNYQIKKIITQIPSESQLIKFNSDNTYVNLKKLSLTF